MYASRIKSASIVAEAFLLFLMLQALGGYVLTPKLMEMFPSAPLIGLLILFTDFAFVGAILYLWARTSYIPNQFTSKEICLYLPAGIVATWLVALLSILLTGRNDTLVQEILSVEYPYFYPTLCILIFIGPLLEETLYRGYFFEVLRGRFGDAASVLFISLLFTFSHFVWTDFHIVHVFIFLDSIVFTVVYIKGGLVASILVHAFTNFYLLWASIGA